MADEKKSALKEALPWVAGLAGLAGLAYMGTRPATKPAGSPAKAAPKRKKRKGSKKAKAAKEDVPKRPPGAYARFVQAQMPALMKRGMSSADAMREIGRLWRAR